VVEEINTQKGVFVFYFGGLSLTYDWFELNSIINRMIALSSLTVAAIFKGEIHQGAVSDDFAVFNFKIQFLNFRNP